jgi:hypothetical protein
VITKSCDGYTVWFDNLERPYQMMAIDCDPLLRLLRGKIYDRQKAIAEELVSGAFSEQSVKAKLDAWQSQVADAIQDDPLVDGAHWKASVSALLSDLPKLQKNVRLMMSGLIPE